MGSWLFVTGLVSILGQVVLLRELDVSFYGSELVYVLALGVWLVWTATGTLLGHRRTRPGVGGVRVLLAAFAAMLPLGLVFLRALRLFLGGVPGAFLPFSSQLAGLGLALMPVGLLSGLLFQWTARIHVGRGHTLAAAYAVESLGGLAGGLLATALAWAGVQPLTVCLVCSLIAVGAGLRPVSGRWPRAALVPALVALPLLVALGQARSLDHRLTGLNHPHLVATRDSPYGRVTVEEHAGLVSVFTSDALAYESQGTAAEEFVHLTAVQHPAPARVLVLGGGVEGVVEEALRLAPVDLDYVELDPVLLELVAPHLLDGSALRDQALQVIIADPRRFLAETTEAWDLILVGMPEPTSGRTNRYYTSEFFQLCAARLAPGGVLGFTLQGAENHWPQPLVRRTASIHRALSGVFADVVVLPGSTNVVLASDRELLRDPVQLAERLSSRSLATRLVGPAYLDYLYTGDRFEQVETLLAESDSPENTDARPVCYRHTLVLWLSRFFPGLAARGLPEVGWPGWLGAGAVLVALTLVARRRSGWRRAWTAAVAGWTGMVLEGLLVLQYQVTRGVLFQDLGLLLTLFMAGLALGAAGMAWWSRGGELPGWSGAALVGGFVLFDLFVAAVLHLGLLQGVVATSALLLCSGSLVAALFAWASLHGRPDQGAVTAPLYAADLIGGSLGSVAASLVLIPSLGLAGSAVVAAAITALVAPLVVHSR